MRRVNCGLAPKEVLDDAALVKQLRQFYHVGQAKPERSCQQVPATAPRKLDDGLRLRLLKAAARPNHG